MSPSVANFADRANIFTSEVLSRVGQEGIELAKGLQTLHDDATDLLGTLGNDGTAINQVQEILDFPSFALTEAWIKTLEVMIRSNEDTIRAIKARKRRK